MARNEKLLSRGIQFIQTQRYADARILFHSVLSEEPKNKRAWAWYVETYIHPKEKAAAFAQFLDEFPGEYYAYKQYANLLEALQRDAHIQADRQNHQIQFAEQELIESNQHHVAKQKQLKLLAMIVSLILVGLILLTNGFTLQKVNILVNELSQVHYDFAVLDQVYQSLAAEYNLLNSRFSKLSTDYQELGVAHTNLESEHLVLVDEYNHLNANYHSLENQHAALQAAYSSLTGEHQALQNIAVVPPYISVHDRVIEMAFYDIRGSLIYWTTPFSNLEQSIIEGNQKRNSIFTWGLNTYRLYFDNGASFLAPDFSIFIAPGSFRSVIGDIYNQSASDEDFITQVWQIIGQLSNYASDVDGEIPRYPSETMLAGGGDCEDLSILFASMIQAAPVDWYVDLFYIDADNLSNPVDPNHVIVFINTGRQTYLIETTSDQEMRPFTNGVRGWLGSQMHDSNDSGRYPVTLY